MSKRVLVAIADEGSRSEVVEYLTEWGYMAVAATDGREAWKILRAPNAPRTPSSTPT